MKRKLAWVCMFVAAPLIGLSLGWLLTIFFLGHSKKEPEWPIQADHRTLHSEYIQDNTKADLKYKGKYLLLADWNEKNEMEKYVTYLDGNGREIVRCYYEGPITYYGGERCGAEGFCEGLENGIVILKKGKAYCFGGPDW
jgi:hypothetical protein